MSIVVRPYCVGWDKSVDATIGLAPVEKSFQEGETVTTAILLEKKIIKKELSGVKVLGNGKLTKKLVVEAKAFSASAKKAIEDLGGEAKVIA